MSEQPTWWVCGDAAVEACVAATGVTWRSAHSLASAVSCARPGVDVVVWDAYQPVGPRADAFHELQIADPCARVVIVGSPGDVGTSGFSDVGAELVTTADQLATGLPAEPLTRWDPNRGRTGFKRVVLALRGDRLAVAGAFARAFVGFDATTPASSDPADGFSAFLHLEAAKLYRPTHYPIAEVVLGNPVWIDNTPISAREIRATHQTVRSITVFATCHDCGGHAETWGSNATADGILLLPRCPHHQRERSISTMELAELVAAQGAQLHVVSGPLAVSAREPR